MRKILFIRINSTYFLFCLPLYNQKMIHQNLLYFTYAKCMYIYKMYIYIYKNDIT